MAERKLGIAVVGLGGAVGTTMAAGIELLRQNAIDTTGLPLADVEALADLRSIKFAGWDLFEADLAAAAETHDVLTHKQFVAVHELLAQITPWPAVGDPRFLANISGDNQVKGSGHRAAVEKLRENLRDFSAECDSVCVINLASTEKLPDAESPAFTRLSEFEKALDADASEISPAMLYAYAAIAEGIPYGNFTPSVAADIPALREFADSNKVPIAGKDGKTGQTFIKTVLAPALHARALHIDGWYSTNILGNRDGLALSNEDSLASKIKTQSSVLEDIVGYEVADQLVDIR
jgi:myo-inositol-1-phosphate synthase